MLQPEDYWALEEMFGEETAREMMLTLFLLPEGWHRPPLVISGAIMDKLADISLVDFEDRDDGRYYILTSRGKRVQDALKRALGSSDGNPPDS